MLDVARLGSGIPLVARDRELDRLRAAFDQAAGGTAAAVLVSGDAGVGKTRLTDELAALARDKGGLVLTGRCLDAGETGLPYLPFAEAMTLIPDRERQVAEHPALVRLFPDITLPGAQPAGSRGLSVHNSLAPGVGGNQTEQDIGQLQLFDGVHVLLTDLAAESPVVLVLEDLHWADASTRDLLLYLSRALARTPVLLVITCRTDEFAAAHPVATLLAELTRAPHTERLHLAPLDRAEVTALARAVLGTDPADQLVETLMVRAEGNPFFTEELLAAGDAVPYNVHEIVASRLARLSDRARRLARLASVVGRTVPHDLLVDLEPGPSLGTALRELVDHGQLVTVDPDSYTFRHALIHESLYRDLLPGERRSEHARVARCLDANPRLASVRSAAGAAAELARHWAAAAEPTRALASSVRAAEAAEAGLAPVEAHAQDRKSVV